MKITITPKTQPGRWSVGLIIAFLLLFISFQLLVASGQRGGETFFSNPVLTIPIVFAGISDICAFFTGLLSIIRKKERSILVFLATMMGFFVLVFVLGEILVPH